MYIGEYYVNYHAKTLPRNLWGSVTQGDVYLVQNVYTIPIYMTNNGMI